MERPDVQEMLQRRNKRLMADRQLRYIMENGGIHQFVSAEIAKAIAPLMLRIAELEEDQVRIKNRLHRFE